MSNFVIVLNLQITFTYFMINYSLLFSGINSNYAQGQRKRDEQLFGPKSPKLIRYHQNYSFFVRARNDGLCVRLQHN
jgi:hypothetical protein